MAITERAKVGATDAMTIQVGPSKQKVEGIITELVPGYTMARRVTRGMDMTERLSVVPVVNGTKLAWSIEYAPPMVDLSFSVRASRISRRRGGASVVALVVHEAGNVPVSGMVSFRHPRAAAVAAATRVFTLAESLGGVESLIEVPQAMTHQSVEGSSAAVPADLIRLSCGVEAPGDLVEDLRQALESAG